jgi:hypothetical protein
VFPICGSATLKRDGDDLDLPVADSVDDAVRKTIEEIALGTEEARPALRRLYDFGDGVVDSEDKLDAKTRRRLL